MLVFERKRANSRGFEGLLDSPWILPSKAHRFTGCGELIPQPLARTVSADLQTSPDERSRPGLDFGCFFPTLDACDNWSRTPIFHGEFLFD